MSVAATVPDIEQGVLNLTAAEYHAPSDTPRALSFSGAKLLLPPSCPAKFHHSMTSPRKHNAIYDFGHVAHALVLGAGERIEVIDADDWRLKATQEKRKQAYADGLTPILADDYMRAREMAGAVNSHPIAGELFRRGTGQAEQSLFWIDQETGVHRRAMVDWLPDPVTGCRTDTGGLILPDLKTTDSAEPSNLAKSIYQYCYHMQGAYYLDGMIALGLSPDGEPAFVLVFVEKAPPHLVAIVQMTPEALQWGRVLNRKAIDIYRRCCETDTWPGYPDTDKVLSISLPGWAERQYETAWERGDLTIAEDKT